MNHQNLLRPLIMTSLILLFLVGCSTPSTSVSLTTTATPAPPTATPMSIPSSVLPHSLVVVESALTGDTLYVLIQDTDSSGEKLDTVGLGLLCLSQGIYVVDESSSHLECVNVGDVNENPDQIIMIFSGASSDHKYQLVMAKDPPIDLSPEQVEAGVTPVTTSVQGSGPQIGHWEGQPSVSFEIGADGNIYDFNIVIDFGGLAGSCTATQDNIVVEADGSFTFTFGDPAIPGDNTIKGKFGSDTSVSGEYSEGIACFDPSTGQGAAGVLLGDRSWNAEWKNP